MIRISGSVGRGGKNGVSDVTLVQAALKVSSGAAFTGKTGVRPGDQFFRALERFLAKNAPEEGGLLRPTGKGKATALDRILQCFRRL